MTDFSSSPFGNTITSTDVLTLLTAQAGWQNKYRQLIQLGNNEERLWFGLDSDARIVKGLMAALLAAVNGKTRTEIASFDIDDYFAQLGFMQQLSPSRGNGLKAVIAAIKAA